MARFKSKTPKRTKQSKATKKSWQKRRNPLCEIRISTEDNQSTDQLSVAGPVLDEQLLEENIENFAEVADSIPPERYNLRPLLDEKLLEENKENFAEVADSVPPERDVNWCRKKYDGPKLKRGAAAQHIFRLIPSDEYESIAKHPLEIEKVPATPVIEGNRIVELGYFVNKTLSISHGHALSCNGQLVVSREENIGTGLVSEIELFCQVCGQKFELTTENPKKPETNMSCVWGVLATGSTHTHLTEQLACMNIPPMNQKMFQQIENNLSELFKSCMWESMEAAGLKEKANAVENGQLCPDGTPWISVYVDGSWSRRSYGTNYAALSGMVGIIGKHTGEVLFIAVRNKYCCICARAENQDKIATPPLSKITFIKCFIDLALLRVMLRIKWK